MKICYPNPTLKSVWVERAMERYRHSCLEKDRLAVERIVHYWDEDIAILSHYTDHAVPIMDPNLYDLKEMFPVK